MRWPQIREEKTRNINQEIFCNGGVHGLMVIDKRDYNKVWGLGMK